MTLLLVLILLAVPVGAQTRQVESPNVVAGFWSPVGLQGQEIRAVSADPADARSLYAATRDGVYRMAGGSWHLLSKDLPGVSIYSLAVSSKAGSGPTLYVGTGGVLYEGVGDGRVWDIVLNELTGPPFHAIAVSPSGELYAGNIYGVGRRAAGAQGWDSADNGMTSTDVRVIALDPESASILYAGTADGGIFKSVDSGQTWVAMNAGITSMSVSAMAIDPHRSGRLLAGSSSGILFLSDDRGASWTPLAAGADLGAIGSILVDPTSSNVVYVGTQKAGVIRSVDGGRTWKPLSEGLNPAGEKVVLASAGDTVYAGTGDGVFMLLRDAEKIAAAKKKTARQPARKVVEAPPPTVSAPVVRAIAIDPATPSTLYIGTAGMGILKSLDGGETWSEAGEVDAGSVVVSLAIDPTDSSLIYAGTRGKILKSTNAGKTWETMFTDLAGPFFYVAVTREALYQANEYGVGRRENGGEDWDDQAASEGVTNARSLAVDPVGSLVLVGTRSGVYRLVDGRARWKACGPEVRGPVTAIVLVPSRGPAESAPTPIFAASDGSGVFRSMDHGQSWQPGNDGLFDRSVQALAVDPRSPNVLYAGTFGNGVFKSTDGGKHWRASDSGLLSKRVRALAVDPSSPSTVYAGTEGGVFKSTNAGKSWKRK